VIGAFEPGAERRMAERPAIVILDDEPVALSALLDALARRFGSDYRVVSHLTADACLAALAAMKSASEEVALIVADQWMPGMTGSELLARAHRIFPAAKRALLVAWEIGPRRPRSSRAAPSARSTTTSTSPGALRRSTSIRSSASSSPSGRGRFARASSS